MTYLLVIVLANIPVIIENPHTKSEFVQLPFVNKLMNINYTFTSLLFCTKPKFCKKYSERKGIKIVCFNIVFMDRTKNINNFYTKLHLVSAQYIAKSRYDKQMFTSLLFRQYLGFCKKIAEKKGFENDLLRNRSHE